jgi:hypothetical protein
VAGVLQVLAEAGAPAAGALDAEDELIRLAVALGPTLQLGVARAVRGERELAEQLTERVERHRPVALLVAVDPDCDHGLSPRRLEPGDGEAAGQSCVE